MRMQDHNGAAAGAPLVEVWRGGRLESLHMGHAVVMGPGGQVLGAWGDPGLAIFPRSSCKMIQALPLVMRDHARALTPQRLALSCASHEGGAEHFGAVSAWLADLGLAEGDLRCGAQPARDRDEVARLMQAAEAPCQIHNNCSGKHAGFLMLGQALGGGPEYVDPDHPVQQAVRAAFEEATEEVSPGYGIDGCSAPNFMTSTQGLARAVTAFAVARDSGDARDRAMVRLREAMMAHPSLVAGRGRACTELMRAMAGKAAVKTGAEGVFVGIVPGRGVGIALKIADGATRAAEAAMTGILIALGLLQANDPAALRRLGPITNWRGTEVGEVRTAPGFADRPI